ncbi:MAG TPA: hypothetical protein PLD23_04725 [Armatimonadota bacterium]|nr:hypothetical protein [Armatimonadota bacterium]HQK92782.1 hypothetical protein [Armatimonadota bacterium]
MNEDRCAVRLHRGAEKDLAGLSPPDAQRAVDEILRLENNPLLGRPLQGALKPAKRITFGLSGGWYRAAYLYLSNERVCIVFMIGPRGGFYERAQSRFRALKKQYGIR